MKLLCARQSVEQLLDDPTTDAELHAKLLLVQAARSFAATLGLEVQEQYTSYVPWPHDRIVTNLIATEPGKIDAKNFRFPIVGEVPYKGFFDRERAEREAEKLRARGMDVCLGAVRAYSTLGWFDDPVLSSFIDWPDYRLAGLLFHELTHQQIYIDDDTTFNESLASAVQQVGTVLWLKSNNQLEAQDEFKRWLVYRDQAIALIVSTRAELDAIYASDMTDDEKRMRKAEQFQQARNAHDSIASRHGVGGGFKPWFADGLNNAKIGSVAAYNSRLNAFVRILDALATDFPAFYRYAERLSGLERAARNQCLDAWEQDNESDTTVCPALEKRPIGGA
jgi:predicted aminopeptidase